MGQSLKSKGGNILITVLMVAALLASFYLVYSNFASIGSQSVTHTLAIQKATYNAESGYYAALDWLKKPAALDLGVIPLDLPSLTDGGNYKLTLQRTVLDHGLINIVSTGFFESPQGPDIDPAGKAAYSGVVEAKVRVEYIRDYFAVVPGALQIAIGSDLSNGKVYGKDLAFQSGKCPGPVTKVESASYFKSVSNPTPCAVSFTDPLAPVQLSSELGAPRVAIMSDYYLNLANDPGGMCQLNVVGGECAIDSSWTPTTPNPYGVCYCAGDLVIGGGGPVQISGYTTIYVEGQTKILNSIAAPTTDDWLAVLSVHDVGILGSAGITTVNGTFVTDGAVNMLGPQQKFGQLIFNGGIVAQDGISLAGFQQSRTYKYHPADPSMKLPFLVQSLGWAIRKGKYQ